MKLPREGTLTPDLLRRVTELLAQVPVGSGYREAAASLLKAIDEERIVSGTFGGPSDAEEIARVWEGRVHWLDASTLSACGVAASVNSLRDHGLPIELVGIETKEHRAAVFLDDTLKTVLGCVLLRKAT